MGLWPCTMSQSSVFIIADHDHDSTPDVDNGVHTVAAIPVKNRPSAVHSDVNHILITIFISPLRILSSNITTFLGQRCLLMQITSCSLHKCTNEVM